MKLYQVIFDKTYQPQDWIVDRDLNIHQNTFFRRVIVWITSWVSNHYYPVEIAQKVAEFFESPEVKKNMEKVARQPGSILFHGKNNLSKYKEKWLKSASTKETEKINQSFEKIIWINKPLPGKFFIPPPPPPKPVKVESPTIPLRIAKAACLGLITYGSFAAAKYTDLFGFRTEKTFWSMLAFGLAHGISSSIATKLIAKATLGSQAIPGSPEVGKIQRAFKVDKVISGGWTGILNLTSKGDQTALPYNLYTSILGSTIEGLGGSETLAGRVSLLAEFGLLGAAYYQDKIDFSSFSYLNLGLYLFIKYQNEIKAALAKISEEQKPRLDIKTQTLAKA